MDNDTITPMEVHEAAGCVSSTLRAWHNRLGFLPREGGGWRKYSFADLIAVRLVVILTDRGFQAQDAVALVHSLREHIEKAAHGLRKKILIGTIGHDEKFSAEVVNSLDSASKAMDFDGEVAIVVDLGSIALNLAEIIRKLRGMKSINESITSQEVTE